MQSLEADEKKADLYFDRFWSLHRKLSIKCSTFLHLDFGKFYTTQYPTQRIKEWVKKSLDNQPPDFAQALELNEVSS